MIPNAKIMVLTINVEQATFRSIFGTLTIQGEVTVVLERRFANEFDMISKTPKTEACYSEITRLLKSNLPSMTFPGDVGWDVSLIEWHIMHVD